MRILRELWWALPRLGRAGQGRAVGVLSVWIWWDRFLQRRWKLQYMRPGSLLRYRLVRHRGRPVTLKDGTTIATSDRLIEVHMDNLFLMRLNAGPHSNAWATLETVERDLSEFARQVDNGSLGPVRALHAVTMFATPSRRFGFEVRPVPHTIGWSLRRYFLIGLLPIYHQDGWREYDRMRRDRWPGELWMSATAFVHRWLKGTA